MCKLIEGDEQHSLQTHIFTVHALMPGDFDVVAAMGDSLTAGAGAGASWIFGSLTDYRGQAFRSVYEFVAFRVADKSCQIQHLFMRDIPSFFHIQGQLA